MDQNRKEPQEALKNSGSLKLKIFYIDMSTNQFHWDPDVIDIDPESTPQELAKLVRWQVLERFRGNQAILDDLRRCGEQMSVKCWTSGQFRRSVYLNPEASGGFRVDRLIDGFEDTEGHGLRSLEVMVELSRIRAEKSPQKGGQGCDHRARHSLADLRKSVQQTISKIQASRGPEFLWQIYIADPPRLTFLPYQPLIPRSEYRPSEPVQIVIIAINKTAESRIRIPAQVVMHLNSSINAQQRILNGIFEAWNVYCFQHHHKNFAAHVQDFMPKSLSALLRVTMWVRPQIPDANLIREGGLVERTVYYFQEGMDLEDFFDGREERSLTIEAHLVPDDP
jgi:hypothetical protein